MKVKANGKETLIDNNTSLLYFLQSREVNPSLVVVELNYEIPKKEIWESIILNEGDNIEVVKFIGGG